MIDLLEEARAARLGLKTSCWRAVVVAVFALISLYAILIV